MMMQELVIGSDLANLTVALAFVRDRCAAAGLSEDAAFACELAADEACTNIIEHAYRGRKDGQIRITCHLQDEEFIIRLHDHGKPFDPTKIGKPPLNRRLEEREIGGLGLHFMRSMMDEVHFEFDKNAGNTLTMVKRIGRNVTSPNSAGQEAARNAAPRSTDRTG